ncbi:unnamed protein product [Zymoseptoria tritici ST99CH_3D7]|uniref:Uncharacterized protein n=1 Tax=Zymoseptoria tritici (strain ST99CH_3D7) TaxID=1276538 RepID=A0A1X7RDH6_ZYMT9|nr:unnamed protein product [Zymoseptoria tritici ST99CH_3D7]
MPSATLSSTMPDASPFQLREEDLETLSQSDGFTILRQHLAQHYTYDLCEIHSPCHVGNIEKWLIVRDVLHALLVPIVELFDKACGVAAIATGANRLEDLEYAFTGPSRGAFVWLQCFFSSEKERDWALTRGCPACVADHCLDSEFSVRLLHAACLLSDVHYPFTMEGPTLPSFIFFLESLEQAINEDEIFGDDFYERMMPKAIMTRDGIEDLIHQCIELDIVLSQPSSPDSSSPTSSATASPVIGPCGGQPGMKIKRSKMAKRQMKLQREEEAWIAEMLRACNEELQYENDVGERIDSQQSIEAAMKNTPGIAVNEIVPE